MCSMLDMLCSLEVEYEDMVPSLVIQLKEGDLSPISRVLSAYFRKQLYFSLL